MAELRRVLLVDDEPNVLQSLRRHLRGIHDVTTAGGGEEALVVARTNGPFAVICSDLRMPGMDGAQLLVQMRAESPDTTRVLLTGQADVESAIKVINEGGVFRFLTKPCPPVTFVAALADAVHQNELVTAERVLLEQTLHGSVKMLTDVLALANPAAFGRATRLKRVVAELAAHLGIEGTWQCEVAAMLSQIGCVNLPAALVDKLYHGRPLSEDERAMTQRLPGQAEKLLGDIPRLEGVREILHHQSKSYDGTGRLPGAVTGDKIPWGARALKVASDFDTLVAAGVQVKLAIDTLRGRVGTYDPQLIQALTDLDATANATSVREIRIVDLSPGLILAADIVGASDLLIVARGYEVTEGLIERLTNMRGRMLMTETVLVLVPASPAPARELAAASA